MKRVLGLVLAGLIGAGTLFSGVGIAHAEGEAVDEEQTNQTVENNSDLESNQSSSNESEKNEKVESTDSLIDQEAETNDSVVIKSADENNVTTDDAKSLKDETALDDQSLEDTTDTNSIESVENKAIHNTEKNEDVSIEDKVSSLGGGDGEYLEKVLSSDIYPSEKRITYLLIDVTEGNRVNYGYYPTEDVKKAAKNFCKIYLEGSDDNCLDILFYTSVKYKAYKTVLGKTDEELENFYITNIDDAYKVIDEGGSGGVWRWGTTHFGRNLENTLERGTKGYNNCNIVVFTTGEPYDSNAEGFTGYNIVSGSNGPFTSSDSNNYIYGNKAVNRANLLPDDVNVYTIGFFEEETAQERDYCQRLMKAITKGNGNYYDVASSNDLDATFRQVAYDIVGKKPSAKTSTNSPYADNYNLLVSGNAINSESFKNLANYIYKDNSAVIPGIEQTNMGDNKTLCKNMVAQGVCVTDKYMLISAYCADGDHSSVIYVLDKNTRQYITTLVLNEWVTETAEEHISHVGALEYSNGVVYVADSGKDIEGTDDNDGDYRVWKKSASDIDTAVAKGTDAENIYMIDALNTDPLEHKPSFIEIYNGYIYVGTFSENNDNNKLYVYNLNNGNYLKKTLSLNVGKAQGISFFEKNGQTYCIISSSHGKENTSNLYVSKCKTDNGMVTEIEKPFKTFKAPNMSEDVDIYEDELFLAFESGANKYALNGGSKIRPLDRVVSLDYKKLVDSNDYPVIVVPGVMGSNLYQNGEKIWSPSLSELLIFLNADRLKISNNLSVKNYDSNGNPIRQNNQGKREYGANDSYKELVDGLCDSTGKPVYFFSYDWRQSNADSAKKLYEFIEKVKTQENVGKVDIVAHSMGGIVTSYYASHKFNDGTKETAGDEQINKIITCSTPYEGSPLLLEKALGTTVLRNVNADYKGYLISSAADAFLYYMEGIKKDVKTKFPSMTQLAPSDRLYNQTPWFRQSNVLRNINYAATSENIAKNGTEIMGATLKLTGHQALGSAVENAGSYVYDNINKQYSYSYAKNQLEGYDYNAMTYSEYASLCSEDRHFGSLYGQSRNFLSQIEKDGYNYLRSMDNAYFIVGVNNYTPVSGAFSKDGNTVQKLIYESKGDGTVPYNSQTMMKGTEGLVDSNGKKRFYTFTTDHGGTTGHTDISYDRAGAKGALDCVIALINDGGESTADPVTGKKHLVVTIQCPVDAKIEKDGEMLNSSNSDFSGTASFGRLDLIGQDGDVKSLCIDDEIYNVQLTGTGTGTMDLDLEWFNEDDEMHVAKQFIDIPITENTRLHFENNKDGITTLYADIDGDGTDDQKWYADNGEVGYQLTSEISGENQEEQKQEEQKQEESQEKTQPATQSKASASTAQTAQVAKAAPAVTSAATTASKTGDTNLTALWITLSAVSAGIVTAMVVAIKKRRAE